jgi:type IV pilus assembly protein PilC
LLQVAEETGELRKILLEIVDYMEKQQTTAAKVKKALTYPAIVLVVGIGAAFILITFALPAMTGLFLEFGAELPLATRMLIDLSELAQAYGMLVLGGIIGLGLVVWRYVRTPAGRRQRDRLILKMPVIGKIIERSGLSRLCSTMSTLLAAGIPMTETIRLAQDTIDNRVIQEGLGDVYRETLTGAGFEMALRRRAVFPPLFAQTVAIGEETGALRSNLAGLATFYDEETDRAIARATDMIEPAVIIVIGIVVGFIAVAIMSAIYAIVPEIG